MRARLFIATLSLAVVAPALAAQSPIPRTPPQIPSPFADTVIVSSFALGNGATFVSPGPISMNHKLLGKKPSHFRASKFADFRDAPAWVTYPSTVPTFSGSNSGACAGQGVIKIVAHFQVRAPKVIGNEGPTTFVVSNVARDTTCMMISG